MSTAEVGVVAAAVLANLLWGSAAPCIKLGYRLFAVGSEDVMTQILFAGIRFTLGVDSYVCVLDGTSVVEVCKAPYSIQLVRIEHQNFFSAIRDKLMWGM